MTSKLPRPETRGRTPDGVRRRCPTVLGAKSTDLGSGARAVGALAGATHVW